MNANDAPLSNVDRMPTADQEDVCGSVVNKSLEDFEDSDDESIPRLIVPDGDDDSSCTTESSESVPDLFGPDGDDTTTSSGSSMPSLATREDVDSR